jgi:putative radical SAM enzyme (TIGR03279 family)
MLRVAAVAPDSVGARLGLARGDELLAVDGRELVDFLDWEFLAADETFVLRARTAGGEPRDLEVERPEGLPLGVVLDPPKIRRCSNRCDFCFVDGNPTAARKSLLIRDDDYRLSFRYGNFATLSNLKDKDVRRILEYRLSPLYVSVHATDAGVRRRLLRNAKAPAILPQLEMFAAGGIRFHAQIVVVPGVNDGAVLERSLRDLYAFGAPILSVSVVPVALTAYSNYDVVRAPTPEEARRALRSVRKWSARARGERGTGWVYGSDELYMLGGEPFPPADAYDDFQQVENGVGAVRYLQTLIAAEARQVPALTDRRLLVLTGTAMGALMPAVLETLERTTGARFDCAALENSYFGPSVTTAGLLPGADFQRALAARAGGGGEGGGGEGGEAEAVYDLALLPAEAVNDDGLFVDDVSLAALVASAPMPVRLSYHFTDALGVEAPV